MGALPIDGIQCNQSEGAVEHVHAHLELYDKGRPASIPDSIGIPPGMGCLYWIHTHTADGYIHIESPVKRPFTLGQFFDIWGQDLTWSTAGGVHAGNGRHLSIWVNGAAWHGHDPRSIVLSDHETIVVQNGPPFAKPAASDWDKM